MTEWKAVKGYEGYYEASDAGDIRRIKGGKGTRLGTCLKGKIGTSGYREVVLAKDTVHRTHLVHRLVAQAFWGKSELQVNHLNCDKLDNRLSNLEMVTQSENIKHGYENGRHRWKTAA